jgi:hypothetical protein
MVVDEGAKVGCSLNEGEPGKLGYVLGLGESL